MDLNNLCKEIRKEIIEITYEAQSGHTAGPLGAVEQYVSLYFSGILKENDKIIISNGHYAPLFYIILAHKGYLEKSKLKTLRKFGSALQGHPHRGDIQGIENTSGPVGEGLSQAIGVCIASNLDKNNNQIYCLMGDGEHDEGNVWEAVMLAGKLKLENLTAIIDRNYIQIDGGTEDVMPLDPLKAKYESFGWSVLEVDGHNIKQIINALIKAKKIWDKPVVIICRTTPGKGVSFIEHNYAWHGKVVNKEEKERALQEINAFNNL